MTFSSRTKEVTLRHWFTGGSRFHHSRKVTIAELPRPHVVCWLTYYGKKWKRGNPSKMIFPIKVVKFVVVGCLKGWVIMWNLWLWTWLNVTFSWMSWEPPNAPPWEIRPYWKIINHHRALLRSYFLVEGCMGGFPLKTNMRMSPMSIFWGQLICLGTDHRTTHDPEKRELSGPPSTAVQIGMA